MTFSAVARKSVSDLTRRRGRALFAVAALALAVASVSLFALPTLMSRAMNREIAANKLADVTITVKPLPLSAAQIAALRRLPNVGAFAPRTTFSTRAYVGARRMGRTSPAACGCPHGRVGQRTAARIEAVAAEIGGRACTRQ